MAKRTAADQFVEILLAAGVQRMYGVVGDSLNPVVDAVRRHDGIDWVHVRHEEAGAFAAGAEAQLTGRLVACAGSCGPGNLHLINGLYDAHRSMAPVLALAAQIPSTEIGTGYFQETHPTLSFQECSHYCELVTRSEQLPRVTQIAVQQAIGRGGVGVVALPGDVADDEASDAHLEHTYRLDQRPSARPSDAVLDELVGLVNGARRVTLFCGRGVAEAHDEVLALAERLKAPVGHALRGKEWIQYDNPYDVGMTGLLGYGACYEAMHSCDLLVLLGTDFPYVQFMPTKPKIVQVDVRRERLGSRSRLDLGVWGDVKETVRALAPRVAEKPDRTFLDQMLGRHHELLGRMRAYADEVRGHRPIHPEHVAAALDELAADDAIFTPPLVKLLWFREQQPDVWQRAAHWVGIKEYVLYRLAGLLAVDESIASATGLYGLAARDWDAGALDLVELRREQLPALHATTDVAARLGADVAAWGLQAGTPIVVGASDGVLANLGVNAVAPGVAACSIGTSAAIRGVVRAPSVDEQGRVFCYVLVPGRWVVGGATNNGGNVLRWLGRVAGADLPDPDAGLTELAATVPPGAEGLLMLPYLSGERAPRWAGDPCGAFLGLTQRHTRAHLARAALEGVCLQLALVLEAMQAAGLELAELRATGGFARSPFWRQLLADVLGTPIGFPASEQGSAAGAALLGHVALGRLGSVDDAAALVRVTEVVHPGPDAARFYRRLLPAFARTAEAVEDLDAWRADEARDGLTHAATGQASKEELP
jgi:sugar (pentulose or hexulose) kinase